MLLRAALLAKFGSIPGHPILDINQIIQWFWDSLTISRDEAEKKAANWKNCQIEEIRELRKIKNRLKILSILDDSEQCQLNEDLKAWLSIREKLP